jgi:hypothetical protein
VTAQKERPLEAGGPEGASDQAAGGGSVVSTVHRRGDIPRANASVAEPGTARSTYGAFARCPWCGLATHHRFRGSADIDGAIRRGACGHRYVIKVWRTYGPRGGTGIAA